MKKNLQDNQREKLFNFRPCFFAAVFLCVGIAFCYVRIFYGISMWWLLVGLALLLPVCFCRSKERLIKVLLAVALLTAAFFAGAVNFSYRVRDFADCTQYNSETTALGVVVDKREYDNATKLVLKDLYIEDNSEEGKLIAYVGKAEAAGISLSDEVLIKGYVQTDVDWFNEYGFRASDIGDGVRFALKNPSSCTVVGHKFSAFAFLRTRMQKRIYSGMDEDSAAVTLGVLTGDTSTVETDLLANIRMGGIAHIFAVSGLHVGALYAFFVALFNKTSLGKMPKIARFLLLTALLLFYAGVCGFSASVMRAVVICLISYAASLLFLSTDFLESLGVAAIVVLTLTPTALFEVGFQLSFTACLGLALLSRPIRAVLDGAWAKVLTIFPRKPQENTEDKPPSISESLRRKSVSFFAATLAAQIATAPILLNSFGSISGWSLLLNFIFVPILSAAFSLLLLFVLVACLLPAGAAAYLLYVPSVVWSGLLLVFETVEFSSLALTGVRVTWQGCVCYYSGCTFLSDKWNLQRKWRRRFELLCFLALGITLFAGNFFA